MQNHLSNAYHVPVLLDGVVSALKPASGKRFIDATLGGGGHTRALAQAGATVLAIDVDPDAISEAETWLADYPSVTVAEGSFEHLDEIARQQRFTAADGILFDLGVSSHQLETVSRGFSFQHEGPLDMRMSPALAVRASDLVNGLSEKQLAGLFKTYGEEHKAKRIAKAIVAARSKAPIETTGQLAKIITDEIGERSGSIHAATRVFQALRIAVNSELMVLKVGLEKSLELVANSGIIAVISFHSLEDRVVKHEFRSWEEAQKGEVLTKKPIEATEEERAKNPRSRSAKLRLFKKSA